MNRHELADFLRSRRALLQPTDVELSVGRRRRTPGLRREEVAQLARMSTDYYSRLEQARSPQPSAQVTSAISRALRLTDDERDHLYHLVGLPVPHRLRMNDQVESCLTLILDRLEDNPAVVLSPPGDVLAQNRMAMALLGDVMSIPLKARNITWRWFTDPSARRRIPPEDWDELSHVQVAELRAYVTRNPVDARGAELVKRLLRSSPEFSELWKQHDVAVRLADRRTFIHPVIDRIELNCEMLTNAKNDQQLIVYTAQPGTESHERLRLLQVVGTQEFDTAAIDRSR